MNERAWQLCLGTYVWFGTTNQKEYTVLDQADVQVDERGISNLEIAAYF